jgi:hypothetical protein
LLLTYVPQTIFDVLYVDTEEYYRGFDQFRVITWMLPLFVGLTLLFWWSLPDVRLPRIRAFEWIFEAPPVRWIVAILSVFWSIRFLRMYGISYRHSAGLLSQQGLWVSLFLLTRIYIKVYVFYRMMQIMRGESVRRTWEESVNMLAFLLVLILSLNGSFDLPYIAITAICALPPGAAAAVLLRSADAHQQPIGKRLVSGAKVGAVGFAVVVGALFIGRANKIGVDGALAIFTDLPSLISYLGYATKRLSSSYASLQGVGSLHLFDLDLQIRAWSIPFESFYYRLGLILGLDIPRPEITSLSRLNFLTNYIPFHPRSGSSPGLLAASLYFPLFPLNVLITTFLTALLLRFCGGALPGTRDARQTSFIGLLGLLMMIMPFFDSPLDFFVLIDPDCVYLVLALCAIYAVRAHRETHANAFVPENQVGQLGSP